MEESIKRCEELIKPEKANWIGISNQEAIKSLLDEYKKKMNKQEEQAINECMRDCRILIKALEAYPDEINKSQLTRDYVKAVDSLKQLKIELKIN